MYTQLKLLQCLKVSIAKLLVVSLWPPGVFELQYTGNMKCINRHFALLLPTIQHKNSIKDCGFGEPLSDSEMHEISAKSMNFQTAAHKAQ